MKRIVYAVLLSGLSLGVSLPGRAQVFELQQLLLDIQKLSTLKGILQDLKDGYAILDKGYSTIRDISKGSFDLHKAFLDALLTVSPEVRKYKRVADIIQLQGTLISHYQAAWGQFSKNSLFQPGELSMISGIYSQLLDASVKNLANLTDVLTDGTIRASDAERLRQIDAIYGRMQKESDFMDRFNLSTSMLASRRAVESNDNPTVKSLYGLE